MQTLFVPCTKTSPSIALKTPKVCKFSMGVREQEPVRQKSRGDHSCLLSATFSHSCCGNTGLLSAAPLGTSTGAPSAVAQCPSWSPGPLGPRNASSWLPGLAGGSGVGGVCPGPRYLTALSWRVPRTAWLGQQLGNARHSSSLCICHSPSCLIVFPFCP